MTEPSGRSLGAGTLVVTKPSDEYTGSHEDWIKLCKLAKERLKKFDFVRLKILLGDLHDPIMSVPVREIKRVLAAESTVTQAGPSAGALVWVPEQPIWK